MLKLLFRLLLFGGLAIAGLFIAFVMLLLINPNIPLDAEPTWLYDYQAKFETKLTGDQLIGGGYFYLFDGRDLWIRFRVQKGLPLRVPQHYQSCKPESFEMIQQWFVENVRDRRSPFSWANPWLALPQADADSLNDQPSLKCFTGGTISNKLGVVPKEAGWWILYNSKTQYLYMRYANYN